MEAGKNSIPKIPAMVKNKVKIFSNKFSDGLIGIVSSNRSSLALFLCLLTIVFVYRIQLTVRLFTNPVRPFDFNPAHHSAWFTLAYLPYDLALVLVCVLLFWLLSRMTVFIKQSITFPICKFSGLLFLHIGLFVLLLIHGVHGRLLFDVQTGLDTSAIKEAFSSISFIETIKLIEIRDYLFLLFPFGLFWMVFLSPLGLRLWMARFSIVLVIFLLTLSLLVANKKNRDVPDEVRLNPALFLLSDVTENVFAKHSAEDRNINVVRENRSGIPLSRTMEYNPMGVKKFPPTKKTHPWNIIFFVMESVGTRYIFNTEDDHTLPMPFLHKISKEGWFLKKHYTTSNVSTKAIFSLFSGVYDFF